MSRPLLVSSISSVPITTLLFAVLAVFSMFSFITFLCGSTRNMKKLHSTETEEEEARVGSNKESKKLISKLNSNLSNRALSMVKMLSWRKVRAEGEEEEEGDYSDQDEEALWRKNILMGEKCRPLDFSGKIEYGSEG